MTAAQLLDVNPLDYHADPWMSLNASTAKLLVNATPAHAYAQHPRLGGRVGEAKFSDAMDEGTALHQMLLGDDRCDILDFDGFRSNDAKAARDASRAAGRVPMLRDKWNAISLVGESLKEQVAAFPIDPPLFADGIAEQTIVWDEEDVTLRVRPDWLTNDRRYVDDLKKSRSAEPNRWKRAMWPLGYDIQAAFYCRGVKAAFGVTPVFRWVAIEADPPYAMSVHVLSPEAMRAANDKVELAISLWRECLRTGVWPAYAQTVNVVELPAWMQTEWDDTALTSAPF